MYLNFQDHLVPLGREGNQDVQAILPLELVLRGYGENLGNLGPRGWTESEAVPERSGVPDPQGQEGSEETTVMWEQ